MIEQASRIRSQKMELIGLVSWLAVCHSVGAVGAILTMSGLSNWYPSIQKPSFNPPNWVFAPVWMFLYTMMGLSAWLVWRERRAAQLQTPLGWFTIQLALNLAWSSLFFALEHPGLAFVDSVMMSLAILATIISFWKVSHTASIMLIPYLAWVIFATVLNYTIWQLNGGF